MQTVLLISHTVGKLVPIRLMCIAAVAAMCMAFGAAVLWTWLDPDILAVADATPLLGLLGLFLLPAGVIATYRLDRRLRAEAEERMIRKSRRQDLDGVLDHPSRQRDRLRVHSDRSARSAPARRLASPTLSVEVPTTSDLPRQTVSRV